jgi:hypothetical protein
MILVTYDDDRLNYLRKVPKRVRNPGAIYREVLKSRKKQYELTGPDNEFFEVYLRQNLTPDMEDDFSCGLLFHLATGETLTLCRYNGPSHMHVNSIEKQKLENVCHIHLATARYIRAGLKAEKYAEATDRYWTLEGALHCLVQDCNILGITTTPDQTNQLKFEF